MDEDASGQSIYVDPNDCAGLKHKRRITHEELNTMEQKNIVHGLTWLDRCGRKHAWSDAFLRTLHKKLLGDVWEWAGTYRLREANIGIVPYNISSELHNLVGDSHFWAQNKVYSPLEAAAYLHHRMVQIHPFTNGNGRHARIATDNYLERYFDHPGIDWDGNSNLRTISERRTDYIMALRAADGYEYKLLLEFVGF